IAIFRTSETRSAILRMVKPSGKTIRSVTGGPSAGRAAPASSKPRAATRANAYLRPTAISLLSMKKRLDVLLVERGLAESRAQAQALVMAGRVPGFDKAGQQVDDGVSLALTEPPRFVSRG